MSETMIHMKHGDSRQERRSIVKIVNMNLFCVEQREYVDPDRSMMKSMRCFLVVRIKLRWSKIIIIVNAKRPKSVINPFPSKKLLKNPKVTYKMTNVSASIYIMIYKMKKLTVKRT